MKPSRWLLLAGSFWTFSLQAQPAPAVAARGQSMAEAAPLAARFDVTSRDAARGTGSRSTWHLVRSRNRIESFTLGAPSYEIWERDDFGEISLKRVFDADRRVVEYSGADLRAGARYRSWSALASVIDPAELATLQRAGTQRTEFGIAQVYRRGGAGGALEIWWLAGRELPARVVQRHGHERFELVLREVRARAAEWQRASAGAPSDYLAIDAVDFGDMHYDPFVRRVEWLDAQQRPFGTAAHRH